MDERPMPSRETGQVTPELDGPVLLRASRRVVTAHLRLGALLAALALLGWWLRLSSLPLGFGLAAVVQLFWWLHSAVGGIELGPDTVRVRRLVGASTVDPRDIVRFVMCTTSFGRHVRMERYGMRTLRLPAPVSPRLRPDDHFDVQIETIRTWCSSRFGGAAGPAPDGRRRPRWLYPVIVVALVLLAALPDRPWEWVSGTEAVDVPQPCSALDPKTTGLDRVTTRTPLASFEQQPRITGCRWDVGTGRRLAVTMSLYSRSGLHSGRSVAISNFLAGGLGVDAWSTGKVPPIPHAGRLGDASLTGCIKANQFDDGPTVAVVVARKANVVVAAYLGPVPDQSGKVGLEGAPILVQDPTRWIAPLGESELAGLLAVVRAALDSVTVD